MFEERSYHTLDKKGRLAIPARFREALTNAGSETVWVTTYGDCLRCYAEDDWVNLRDQAAGMDEFDADAQIFLRFFVSGASQCPIKQTRITIPQNLRDDAGLNREVVLVGLLNKFEIWDKVRWEEEFRQNKNNRTVEKASRTLKIRPRGHGNGLPTSAGPGS